MTLQQAENSFATIQWIFWVSWFVSPMDLLFWDPDFSLGGELNSRRTFFCGIPYVPSVFSHSPLPQLVDISEWFEECDLPWSYYSKCVWVDRGERDQRIFPDQYPLPDWIRHWHFIGLLKSHRVLWFLVGIRSLSWKTLDRRSVEDKGWEFVGSNDPGLLVSLTTSDRWQVPSESWNSLSIQYS